MINWEKFKERGFAVRVTKINIKEFLQECEDKGLRWRHNVPPTLFNPIEFYSSQNRRFLEPIEDIDNADEVYISCFCNKLSFSFHHDWVMNPYRNY